MRAKCENSLIIFLLLLLANPIAGQTDKFNINLITKRDGLTHNSGLCITQDQKGFLWVGTQFGLNRFNGYEFNQFKIGDVDSFSISGNYINSLFESSTGQLWIGTNKNGLNLYNHSQNKFTNYQHHTESENSIGEGAVHAICEDKFGNVFVGVNPSGLFYLEKQSNQIKKIKLPGKNLSDKIRVYSLMKDSAENIWIGTQGGLFVINYSKVIQPDQLADKGVIKEIVLNSSNKKASEVLSFSEQKSNKGIVIWSAFWNGIYKIEYTPESFQFKSTEIKVDLKGSEENSYWSLLVDSRNMLWVGTYNKGIIYADLNSADSKFNFIEISVTNRSEDISKFTIRNIFEDKSGIIWAGTEENGLLKIIKNKLEIRLLKSDPKKSNSLSDNFIKSLHIDEKYIWVGTKFGGLNKAERNSDNLFRTEFVYKHFRANDKNTIPSDYVRDINKSNNGNLLIACWNLDGGFAEFNTRNEKFITYQHNKNSKNTLSENQVNAVAEDHAGNIWIGFAEKGIDKFNPKTKTFTNYSKNNQSSRFLRDNTVLDLFVSKDGTLWAGTPTGGLNKYSEEEDLFISYTNQRGEKGRLSSNHITQIYESKNELLWLCTNNGINIFDPITESVEIINKKDGLPDDVIIGVLQDTSQNFWVTSAAGLTKLERNLKQLTNFGINDGLPTTDFTDRALELLDEKIILAGTNEGLMVIDISRIEVEVNMPKVVLTSFKIFEKEYPLDTAITSKSRINLDYSQNYFSFEFAALNFRNPEEVKYLYQLEGLSPDWVNIENRRYASFSNIDPGDYKFRVKTLGSKGESVFEFAEVAVVIRPPFWMTDWFRAAVSLFAISLIILIIRSYFIFKYKRKLDALRLENRIREERERISSELHDHVGANLTNIATGLEITQKYVDSKSSSKMNENIKDLELQTRSTINDLRNTIWSLNSSTNTLAELILLIRDFVAKRRKYYPFIKIEITDNLEHDYQLSPTQALNLLRILQESIHNSLKYSGATTLSVEFKAKRKDLIKIIVCDNGVGFNQEKKHFSGISIMKNRAEKIDAAFGIDTQPDQGVKIQLELNLPSIGD
ncbi:MAG: hypothetical protein K9J12_16850 [Melioribacteraceae bacterium]|nr:hypothetical protein [Melioribacteraceae bacterium]MCF8263407.1 hypothetical protein [Melioribacteraceae bacterium]MCF8430405.1 hypothetical protein [Melioribacteraceae bacterium]